MERIRRKVNFGDPSLGQSRGNIGGIGIGQDLAFRGRHDKVHILHLHGSQQNLVSKDQSATEAPAIFKRYLQRPKVRAHVPCAVGGSCHLAFADFLQLQLDRHVLRNTQAQRTRIRQSLHFQRRQLRFFGFVSWIAAVAYLPIGQ